MVVTVNKNKSLTKKDKVIPNNGSKEIHRRRPNKAIPVKENIDTTVTDKEQW